MSNRIGNPRWAGGRLVANPMVQLSLIDRWRARHDERRRREAAERRRALFEINRGAGRFAPSSRLEAGVLITAAALNEHVRDVVAEISSSSSGPR